MKKFFAVFLCALSLAACSSPLPPPVTLDLPPAHLTILNVSTIDVIDHTEFQSSNSPYYSAKLEPTIADAVRKWVKENLQAGGPSGQAIILLQDANLSSRALAMSDSFVDTTFKRQQGSQYSGHVKVQLEIRGGGSFGFADAEASRTITLPENPTLGEKQDAYTTLLNGLMKDFDESFTSSIHQHLQGLIIP